MNLSAAASFPKTAARAFWSAGSGSTTDRTWSPSRDGGLFDLSRLAPTMSDLLDLAAPASAVRAHAGERLMSLDEALALTRCWRLATWRRSRRPASPSPTA